MVCAYCCSLEKEEQDVTIIIYTEGRGDVGERRDNNRKYLSIVIPSSKHLRRRMKEGLVKTARQLNGREEHNVEDMLSLNTSS